MSFNKVYTFLTLNFFNFNLGASTSKTFIFSSRVDNVLRARESRCSEMLFLFTKAWYRLFKISCIQLFKLNLQTDVTSFRKHVD